MKTFIAISVFTLCVIPCCSKTVHKDRTSFVEAVDPEAKVLSKNNDPIKELGAFEKAWEKIDNDTKKKIDHYLMMELGLSSTGKIEMFGTLENYNDK